jgi:hypothetical protein
MVTACLRQAQKMDAGVNKFSMMRRLTGERASVKARFGNVEIGLPKRSRWTKTLARQSIFDETVALLGL